MALHNGQWVKFKNSIPGAHVAADGLTVGIYVRGGTDGLGQIHSDRINVVAPDGHNIHTIVDGALKNVSLPLEAAVELTPMTDTDDLPPARKATLPEGFAFRQ